VHRQETIDITVPQLDGTPKSREGGNVENGIRNDNILFTQEKMRN